MTTETTSPAVPAGYMMDAKGVMMPEQMVKPVRKLEDQAVRKILSFAQELSQQIARFKGHCFDDVGAFMALAAEQYGATYGGVKGGVTLNTFDGTMQVQVKNCDRLSFGPELHFAKSLIDECLNRWSEGARLELKAIVDNAFRVDKEGQVNRDQILGLRNIEIDDDGWRRAKEALSDAIRVEGSKLHMYFRVRRSPTERFQNITIDLASAEAPSAPQGSDGAA
ncbi:MAG: DUF3164 family protein [Desulfobulbaceae bacterium]|nr:MAG: DUF3164 family protein [Desulfobulbaceae bacterium]